MCPVFLWSGSKVLEKLHINVLLLATEEVEEDPHVVTEEAAEAADGPNAVEV